MNMRVLLNQERALISAERACAARAAWLSARAACPRLGGAGRPRQSGGGSAGEGFPDQLGDIDDEVGSGLAWITGVADVAGAHADGAV